MEYAVQMLAIMGLFTAGAVWLQSAVGLPKLAVAALVLVGGVLAMATVIMRVSREQRKKQKKTGSASEAPVQASQESETHD